ncbi:hypothetical protein GQ53DRAFT_749694 [Thozetella sp. PMI_491]|nr:hypothetical protein GQ53DRAFT_749694 [Thozetella sp. PMI_491]
MHSQILSAALFAASVAAHGMVKSPTPRSVGDAFKAACGQQVFNNQAADPNGNIQGMAQVAQGQSDFNAAECNLSLCKGYKFADNTANVQSFSPGQTVDFQVSIVAPHTGVANVSVVNTQTGAMISDPLISFENYASTATGVAANNTAFSVTLPDSLPGCDVAGVCALQWWWDARSIDQTYMSCVDFTTGSGSGSGSGSTGSSSSAVSQPTTLPAAVQSTSASAAATPTTLQTVTASSAAATKTASASCGGSKKKRAARRAARRA